MNSLDLNRSKDLCNLFSWVAKDLWDDGMMTWCNAKIKGQAQIKHTAKTGNPGRQLKLRSWGVTHDLLLAARHLRSSPCAPFRRRTPPRSGWLRRPDPPPSVLRHRAGVCIAAALLLSNQEEDELFAQAPVLTLAEPLRRPSSFTEPKPACYIDWASVQCELTPAPFFPPSTVGPANRFGQVLLLLCSFIICHFHSCLKCLKWCLHIICLLPC